MGWFSNSFRRSVVSTTANSAKNVSRFYQQLGFYASTEPASVVQRYTDDHGHPPSGGKPWDDVFLLAYAVVEVWADDTDADVCRRNEVYSTVLPQWARISHGSFAPMDITESWESERGPITIRFRLGEYQTSVSPDYLDDWIDLGVLQQINGLILSSRRQFECAVDGNFALMLCLTPEQKRMMQKRRRFPFAW
jgi:hypothetical protein